MKKYLFKNLSLAVKLDADSKSEIKKSMLVDWK